MKKVLSLAALALILASCSTQSSKAEGTTEEATVKQETHAHKAGKTIKLNKAQFLEQIMDYENNTEWNYKGELPGLVDFYADWCRPCKITSPILEELAAEYAGKVNIYKIDIQAEQELAAIFNVQSIPTFLFIPKEGRPTMSAGIAQTPEQTKEMFKQQIEQLLLSNNSTVQ